MLTYFQAIILGLLQGITELFPISSLGHSVILPKLFHWNINQSGNFFLIFLVATHLATACVLFGYYLTDWLAIGKGVLRSLKERKIDEQDTYAKLGWLLVVSTVPVGILGLLFEEKIKKLFAQPQYVAMFLVGNGLMLGAMEIFKKRKVTEIQTETQQTHKDITQSSDARIAKLRWTQAIAIGFAQAVALIPGFSRTGSTLGGGLLTGLHHEDAVRYSFLLATPVILAANILKLPDLFTTHTDANAFGPLLVGCASSAIAAYFSVRFLTRYFKENSLTPFAIYCIVFGIFTSLIFL